MKIKNISINNVKSFKDEVIEFNDTINILIGANSGGKSNLLDIITIVMRSFILREYFEPNKEYKKFSQDNPSYCVNYKSYDSSLVLPYKLFDLEESLDKFIGSNGSSEISISFEISNEDIKNIKIIKNNIEQFEKIAKIDISGYVNAVDKWDTDLFFPGQIINYKFSNNGSSLNNEFKDVSTVLDRPEEFFMQYLNSYNLFSQLYEELENISFNNNYLYFSPYRNSEFENLDVSLSSENFHNLSMINLKSTSKTTSSLFKLATYHLLKK